MNGIIKWQINHRCCLFAIHFGNFANAVCSNRWTSHLVRLGMNRYILHVYSVWISFIRIHLHGAGLVVGWEWFDTRGVVQLKSRMHHSSTCRVTPFSLRTGCDRAEPEIEPEHVEWWHGGQGADWCRTLVVATLIWAGGSCRHYLIITISPCIFYFAIGIWYAVPVWVWWWWWLALWAFAAASYSSALSRASRWPQSSSPVRQMPRLGIGWIFGDGRIRIDDQ